MKTLMTAGLCFLLFLALQVPGFAEGVGVVHPMTDGVKYTDGGHCPNCGMNLNMWARTRHQFTSGGEQYETCSIRCVADINDRNGTGTENGKVALYLAPEKMVPVSSAWYVVGSKAKGTMTMKSKIAFADKGSAMDFAKGNGGEVVPFEKTVQMATKELPMSRPKINANRMKKGKFVAPADDANCINCGMFPARYPAFRSQAKNEKGELMHFCSTKCLMKSKIQHPGMKAPWVTVFPTGDMEFAETLWYVEGSSQLGPMGHEPLPFRSKAKAKAFAKEKGGEVLSYKALQKHVKEVCPTHEKGGHHGDHHEGHQQHH